MRIGNIRDAGACAKTAMNTLPLLPDSAAAVLAYHNARPVDRVEFLREVLALAARLPNTGQVLNLCKDRYWFAVTLFAAISRGLLSLLPNSSAPEHLAALCAGARDLVCLGDQACPPFQHAPYMRVTDTALDTSSVTPIMPHIPFDQHIACVFTSGSTGIPQAHGKTFGRVHQGVATAAERVWSTAGGACAVLGTVPFQHMYGLESTVLLPILGGGKLSSRLPFFPTEVTKALAELPAPRLLVTTPFHLRKLLDAGIAIPPVAAVVSATAPLSMDLARRAETQLGAPIMEIYGSTETGQLATRRPTVQIEWETFTGVMLRQNQGATTAMGGHLESAQVLNDVVELISPSSFRLLDRNANMVNIVGKRSSLAFLNHVISSLPGVRDGVFCMPERGEGNEVTRLAAFVVAPGLNSTDITAALRSHLDPVFLPRPIVFLDALPRDGNGKVTAAAMAALIAEHIAPRT